MEREVDDDDDDDDGDGCDGGGDDDDDDGGGDDDENDDDDDDNMRRGVAVNAVVFDARRRTPLAAAAGAKFFIAGLVSWVRIVSNKNYNSGLWIISHRVIRLGAGATTQRETVSRRYQFRLSSHGATFTVLYCGVATDK
jgi:hypothetical protein